jgi:nucleoside-diphosphate-sugar epimerase
MVRPASDLTALATVDVEIIYGDLAQDDGIPSDVLKGVEIVFHIAALYRQEGATKEVFSNVNKTGTERLLKAALQAEVNRFIHCSTGGVHGHIENPPANESAPLRPGDWYQETKLAGEQSALAFHREHNFPVTVIRPSPIYGAGDMRFLKLFRTINNGTFWMVGDGKALYHFVYIDDLVRGFIQAGEREQAIGEVFIISGPEYTSINTLVKMIAEELGKPVPRRRLPIRPVMASAKLCKAVCSFVGITPPLYPRRLDFFIKDRAFDSTKARSHLGYEPSIDIKTGIALTASWYRKQNYL